MKINNKSFPLITLLILFAIMYMLFAVRPVNDAMHLIPQWTIDITNLQIEESSSKKLFPFKLENNIGYYTSDGVIDFLNTVEQKTAISSSYWAEFPLDAAQTPFFTMTGEQSGTLQRAGFPFFENDRIFLFHPGGNSFSVHESNGSEKWTYEDYVPITTFSSTITGIVAGFADGKIIAFNSEGNIIQKFYPGGSNYEIIFGAALSANAKYTACLSGVDAQRIIISHISENQSKIIFHEYLKDDIYEQTLVQFTSDDQYVFFNAKDELIVVDIKKELSHRIPIAGKVLSITEVGDENVCFILSKKQNTYTVTMLENAIYKVGDFSFQGNSAFLYSDNNDVYIGHDTSISKIKVVQ